jgi:hypothetical protein
MSLILIIILSALAMFMGWCAGVQRSRAEYLKGDLNTVRADFHSYRNVYGPNLMSRMPDITGMVSDAVLVDVGGKGNPSDFTIGYYNLNDKRWTFEPRDLVDENEYPDVMEHGRWYRLPLKKYEDRRLGRHIDKDFSIPIQRY